MGSDADEGDEMAYEPCRYAKRWPDVWATLPTDEDRRQLSDTLAGARLAGSEPTREYVEKLAEVYRGEVTTDQFIEDTLAAVQQAQAAGETVEWLPGVAVPDPSSVARPIRAGSPVDNTAAGTRRMVERAREQMNNPPS